MSTVSPLICNSDGPGCMIDNTGGPFAAFIRRCDQHQNSTLDEVYAECLAHTAATLSAAEHLGVKSDEVDWSFDADRNVVVFDRDAMVAKLAPIAPERFKAMMEQPAERAALVADTAEAVAAEAKAGG